MMKIIVRPLFLLVLLLTMLPACAVKVRVVVSAYTGRHRTATGTRPYRGTCAAPRKWLGCYVKIPGKGSYKVTDVCRRGIDIWLPSVKACRKWGRRTMTVRIERPHKAKAKVKHKAKVKPKVKAKVKAKARTRPVQKHRHRR